MLLSCFRRERYRTLSHRRLGIVSQPMMEISLRLILGGVRFGASSAPVELTAQLGFVAGSDSVPVFMIVPTWCGQRDQGEARLAPFFKLGRVLLSTVDARPYGASLKLFDPYLANGQRAYMESCCLPALSRSLAADAHACINPPDTRLRREFLVP